MIYYIQVLAWLIEKQSTFSNQNKCSLTRILTSI